MYRTEAPMAEFRITAVCTVADQSERQRRLAQVYGLIMDFGRQKRVAAEAELESLAQPQTEERVA
jgi:hypothetical protein